MALGVLNNISAIYEQNKLANTQASLQKIVHQFWVAHQLRRRRRCRSLIG